MTIRQRSIQTIYNTEDESTQTAWGGESIDENEGLLWFYNRNETHAVESVYPYVDTDYGNDSRANGLYNTARLWELTDGTGSYKNALWDDYLDYDRENDHELIFLKDDDDLATARYACLMRNRDDNGDGIIEASEIRWYLASLQQLTALYIGDQGLSSEAKLYDQFNGYGKDEVDEYGSQLWRRHIISSTRWGNGSTSNYPAMLWAEEGLSTSAYKQYANTKPGRYTVRCVRNLGMDPASEQEAIQALNDADRTPEVSIRFQTVEENHSATSVYRFDLSRINKKSIPLLHVPRTGTRRRICGIRTGIQQVRDRAAGKLLGELWQSEVHDRAWRESMPRGLSGAEYPRSESDGELHYFGCQSTLVARLRLCKHLLFVRNSW